MKQSTRVLLGIFILDGLLLLGLSWLVWQVHSGRLATSVPTHEAIGTITSVGGGFIGTLTAILAVAFVYHRRKGN